MNIKIIVRMQRPLIKGIYNKAKLIFIDVKRVVLDLKTKINITLKVAL